VPCRCREEAAKERAEVTSAADLSQDLVGGNIPRTLLKVSSPALGARFTIHHRNLRRDASTLDKSTLRD
jgi:hypothetical protein